MRSVQMTLLAKSSPAEWSPWCWWLSAVSLQEGQHQSSAGLSAWTSVAPSLPPDHEAVDPYLTPPPVGPLWTSGLEGDKKKMDFLLSVWISECGVHMNIYCICLCIYSWEHSENLTSPQASDALLQPVGLTGFILAWILIDYCQVLIPVAPVHLIHPNITWYHWYVGREIWCICVEIFCQTFGLMLFVMSNILIKLPFM